MTKYLYNTLEPLYSLTDIYILVNLFVRASRTHSTEKQKKKPLDKYAANCVPIN